MPFYIEIGCSHWDGPFTLRKCCTSRLDYFTLRYFIHTVALCWLLNRGLYWRACLMIRSLMARSDLSNKVCGCESSPLLIISHAFTMLLVVQNCRGRPAFLCAVSLGSGIAEVVEKVHWWRGCCLSLLSTCPNGLSFLSSQEKLVLVDPSLVQWHQ